MNDSIASEIASPRRDPSVARTFPSRQPTGPGWTRSSVAVLLILSLIGLTGFVPANSALAAPLAEPSNATSQEAAIQTVIQRADAEQAQAIATGDASIMADTVTSAHYRDLIEANQGLLDHGVISISLESLDWDAISIGGKNATATVDETWTTSYADGTVEQSLDRNVYTLVQDGSGWKITGDTHPSDPGLGSATIPTTQLPQPPAASVLPGQDLSTNWSGYAATDGIFTSVTGTWTVPKPALRDPFGTDAIWVGIGGVRSHDLIQAGTNTILSGSGQARLQAWVELLPQPARPVPLAVHPGDSLAVSITEQAADTWLVGFVNTTTGQTYQQTEHYASSHSSAEWVVEAPSDGQGILPLDNFGTVGFSNSTAVENGQLVTIAQANGQPITMLSPRAQTLAVPSALSNGGATFDVTHTVVPSSPGSNGPTPTPRRHQLGP